MLHSACAAAACWLAGPELLARCLLLLHLEEASAACCRANSAAVNAEMLLVLLLMLAMHGYADSYNGNFLCDSALGR